MSCPLHEDNIIITQLQAENAWLKERLSRSKAREGPAPPCEDRLRRAWWQLRKNDTTPRRSSTLLN